MTCSFDRPDGIFVLTDVVDIVTIGRKEKWSFECSCCKREYRDMGFLAARMGLRNLEMVLTFNGSPASLMLPKLCTRGSSEDLRKWHTVAPQVPNCLEFQPYSQAQDQ